MPLDTSSCFTPVLPGSPADIELSGCMEVLRFLNCDMYFTDAELDLLLAALQPAPIPDRAAFFAACQRLRRRERCVWSDTPLARALTPPKEWHLLHVRALVTQMSAALRTRHPGATAWDLLLRFGDDEEEEEAENGNGGGGGAPSEREPRGGPTLALAGLQRLCVGLRLGFSPADVAAVAHAAAAAAGRGEDAGRLMASLSDASAMEGVETSRGGGGGGGRGGSSSARPRVAPRQLPRPADPSASTQPLSGSGPTYPCGPRASACWTRLSEPPGRTWSACPRPRR